MFAKETLETTSSTKHLVPLKASILNLLAQQPATGPFNDVLSLREAILIYIEKDLTTASLQDLAQRYHFSPGHLSKLIHRYTGATFSILYNEVKMRKAKKLLENPHLSILQITLQLNYASTRVFSNAFKRNYAVTPHAYRQKLSMKSSK